MTAHSWDNQGLFDAVLFQGCFVGLAKWFLCCGHFVATAASPKTIEQLVALPSGRTGGLSKALKNQRKLTSLLSSCYHYLLPPSNRLFDMFALCSIFRLKSILGLMEGGEQPMCRGNLATLVILSNVRSSQGL
jgi:hypothetical protein